MWLLLLPIHLCSDLDSLSVDLLDRLGGLTVLVVLLVVVCEDEVHEDVLLLVPTLDPLLLQDHNTQSRTTTTQDRQSLSGDILRAQDESLNALVDYGWQGQLRPTVPEDELTDLAKPLQLRTLELTELLLRQGHHHNGRR